MEVPHPSFAESAGERGAVSPASATPARSAKFRLSIEQIRAAAEVSLLTAGSRGDGLPLAADLDLGARHASSSRLGELAAHLDPAYSWDDLVLPERQLDLLRSISAYLRHRDQVLSEWGYEVTVSRTQGLNVLFAGESGTGKTMAAEVMAAELGLELYKMDLCDRVASTSGRPRRTWSASSRRPRAANAVLFFDEADALFGKRSEVKDAHDRYANVEVSYLLQRMEEFDGIVILATNFRRTSTRPSSAAWFVVEFPFPEEDRGGSGGWSFPPRRRWPTTSTSTSWPRASSLRAATSATGAVRRVPRRRRGLGVVTMADLVRGVAIEYRKLGRLTLETDFERFHAMVRDTGRKADA